jgi:hypothetical protein
LFRFILFLFHGLWLLFLLFVCLLLACQIFLPLGEAFRFLLFALLLLIPALK